MNSLRIDFGFGIGKDKDGLVIPREEANAALRRITKEAAKLFKAYTLEQTKGGWTNGSGKLVEEDGFTLFVIIPLTQGDKDFPEIPDPKIGQLVNFIKAMLNQEAVAITKTLCEFELV